MGLQRTATVTVDKKTKEELRKVRKQVQLDPSSSLPSPLALSLNFELPCMAQLFDRLDRNHDGSITRTELIVAMRKESAVSGTSACHHSLILHLYRLAALHVTLCMCGLQKSEQHLRFCGRWDTHFDIW